MNEIILLKLGELVLKGLNRRSFEDKLQANIHRRLHPYGQCIPGSPPPMWSPRTTAATYRALTRP